MLQLFLVNTKIETHTNARTQAHTAVQLQLIMMLSLSVDG